MPITFDVIIGIISMVALLFASAQVSGSEVAFFSLNPQDKENLESNESGKSARVLQLIRRPDRLLATILISNNLINVAIVVISSFIMSSLFDFSEAQVIGFIFQVVLVTFMLLLFGEILPKVYAAQNSLGFSLLMAGIISYLERFFWNIRLSRALVATGNMFNKNFAKEPKAISINELGEAFELAKENLDEDKNILEGIVKFGNIEVREIMRSRVDVVALEISTPLPEVVKSIIENGYSRIPVYEETFDHIKGILYIKDLLPHFHKNNGFEWQNLLRPPYYTPENKRINDLLKEFQTKKIHLAVVIDEYGGSSGIVTLEDILEEIVGEISDESDDEEIIYSQLGENSYMFEGKILLNDFCKIIDVDSAIFNEIRGEAETLAGLILEMKGEIPEKNISVEYKQFTFTVKSVDKRRIKQIHALISKE